MGSSAQKEKYACSALNLNFKSPCVKLRLPSDNNTHSSEYSQSGSVDFFSIYTKSPNERYFVDEDIEYLEANGRCYNIITVTSGLEIEYLEKESYCLSEKNKLQGKN